jgi:GMP synthase-like glutamine amidotransferase
MNTKTKKHILVIHGGSSYLNSLFHYLEASDYTFEEVNFNEITLQLKKEIDEGMRTTVELDLDNITPSNFNGVIFAGGVIRESVLPGIYREIKRWSRQFIRELTIPFLGICLGHMMLGLTYGATYSVMKRRAQNPIEEEKGIVLITFHRKFPLTPNLTKLNVYEDHERELTRLPNCLINTASSKKSEIQAIYHTTKQQYGVQFHPERKGLVVLSNFLKLL